MLPQLTHHIMNKVTVVINKKSGKLITPSKNPIYGFMRLEQVSHVFGEDGFVSKVTKSALLKGEVAILSTLGYTEGMALPGQIVVTESMTPSNEENLEQDKKVAGESGIVCSVGGAPIYRTSKYTTNLELADAVIAHDNKEAIVA